MKISFFVPVALILIVTVVNTPALAQSRPTTSQSANNQEEKINNIKELMAITGEEKLSQQIRTQLINGMRSQVPQVPQEFWNTLAEEMDSDSDKMKNQIIAIYSKYFTNEDIKELIAFYKTPLGRKVTNVLPQVTRESGEVGQRYGIAAGKRALQRLEAEGYMRSR